MIHAGEQILGPGSQVLILETGEVATVHLIDGRINELGDSSYVLLVTDDGRLTAARLRDLEEISTTAPSELPSNIAAGLRLIEGK